jgi:dimethylglycine dehydrogenase
MAMAYVAAEHAAAGATLDVEILGERYGATVQGAPIYDPSSAKMRG